MASVIRTALFGREVSKYKDGEDDYPIQLRISNLDRNDIASLMNQTVTFRNQSTGKIVQIPINSIAHVENEHSFGAIRRKELYRVVTVYSNITEGFTASDVNAQLKELLENHELGEGYSFKFTGEQESQEKEMSFLLMALLIALFLILIIIVAQFNRVSAPIIILLSVLLSTTGVFLGLKIFDMDFL